MPDHRGSEHGGVFGDYFSRGGADFGDAAWLRAMLDAEAGLARALERAGLAPAGSGAEVTRVAATADFDPVELAELSALAGNPVPGLARVLTRKVAGAAARAVHRGATSQDIMDTAAMLLARQALDSTRSDLERAANAAASLATAHRDSVMIGRTLLQQAVPVTFGVVAAGWLAGLDAAVDGLARARETRLAVQFGGAAGTLASLGVEGTRVKALFAEELGLPNPPLPWHTERLRIIDVATAMARVTAALGKVARDVTLLAQPEVAEVSEGASQGADHARADGQARPGTPEHTRPGTAEHARPGTPEHARPGAPEHTRPGAPRRTAPPPNRNNPVAAIAVLACSRQVPGLLATLVASAEQEHQRAAGAWHAEWQPFSDILRLGSSAAAWGAELLGGLRVDTARMAANLAAAGGLPLAERVTGLLANVLGAPQAYDLVASAAARAASSGLPLRDVLLAAPELEERLRQAGIESGLIEAALEPAGYLGSSAEFVNAALSAHERAQRRA